MDIDRPSRRSRAGLTLVELLTTLATASVTLAVAVPTYRSITQSTAVTTAAHSLYSHLSLTRGEAVDRNEHVVMCPSVDQTGCADGFDWTRGWILFVDPDHDKQRDPDEALLRAVYRTESTVSIQTSSGRRRIVYQPDGTVTGGSNTHFRICVEAESDRNRAVIVSLVGRPRISTRSPDGTAVTCPESG